MNYYEETQYIARVTEHNEVIGQIERWEAHRTGTLHRAITVAVLYEGFVILQHRKHPVFDNVFDATVSSHQLYNGNLADDATTISSTLERELGLSSADLIAPPESKGFIYYRAKDPHSTYIEHEACHIYTCATRREPNINFDYAYGYSLQKPDVLRSHTSPLYKILAPWVKEMLKRELL